MELLETTASPLQVYKQAKRILKSTSRASNPDWYRRSTETTLQWHLSISTHSIRSAIHNRISGEWWEGPELPDISVDDADTNESPALDDQTRSDLHAILEQILSSRDYGIKPKSLGITIHLADGLRTRDLDPEFAADTDFDSLNELVISAPDIALGDDSLQSEEGKWRLIPLLGVKDGDRMSLAAKVSSESMMIVREFQKYGESRNVPVIVEARSAALEAFAGVPFILPEGSSLKETLTLIQFENFTLLGATGALSEVQIVRALMHRSSHLLSPSEVSESITNTAALLNLKSPEIILLSATGVSENELAELLSHYLASHPETTYQCIDACNLKLVDGIPGKCFEFAVATEKNGVVGDSFVSELTSKWAVQDFYSPSQMEASRMPSRGDLKLLKWAGLAQKGPC